MYQGAAHPINAGIYHIRLFKTMAHPLKDYWFTDDEIDFILECITTLLLVEKLEDSTKINELINNITDQITNHPSND